MLNLVIVAISEITRSKANRAYHKKIEADRIEYMWEDLAIDRYRGNKAKEAEMRLNGLPVRPQKPPPVYRSRKSSLSGGFPRISRYM